MANVVESDDPDEGLGVSLLGLFELSNNLGRVGASEHGELPHCPVTSVIVPGGIAVLTVDETVLHHIHQHDEFKSPHKFYSNLNQQNSY